MSRFLLIRGTVEPEGVVDGEDGFLYVKVAATPKFFQKSGTGSTGWESIGGTALALKASLASPVFTGDPRAPTPSAGDNDTSIATTAFVATAVGGGSAPSFARSFLTMGA